MNSLDYDTALKATAGNEKLANDLLQLFIEQIDQYSLAISHALEANEAHALNQSLHKLHGATQYIGTPKLCLIIEQAQQKIKQSNNAKSNNSQFCEAIFTELAAIKSLSTYQV